MGYMATIKDMESAIKEIAEKLDIEGSDKVVTFLKSVSTKANYE
jgi:hypothetical protein